ncbi:MAG TPA: YggT family protein [Candidatus Dormibacteraeota bacterium]|nr:YggT family protein [Candidatus Dormibacteraeota bacterium]
MNVAAVLVGDLATLLDIYALCILAWALLTFFPGASGSAIGRLLNDLVLPVIRPLRRILPSMGGMDFSPLLAIVITYALADALQSLSQSGFLNPIAAVVSVLLQFLQAVLLVVLLLLLIRVLLGVLHVDPWHPVVFAIRRISDNFVDPVAKLTRSKGERAAITAFVIFLLLYIGFVQLLFPIIQSSANRL